MCAARVTKTIAASLRKLEDELADAKQDHKEAIKRLEQLRAAEGKAMRSRAKNRTQLLADAHEDVEEAVKEVHKAAARIEDIKERIYLIENPEPEPEPAKVKKPKKAVTEYNPDNKEKINTWLRKNAGKETETQRINGDPKLIQEKIDKLIEEGAAKYENPTAELFENEGLKGKYCAVITKDGMYRPGGIISKIGDKWFMVRGAGSASFQFNNVAAVYVKSLPKRGVKLEPSKQKKITKFPVVLNGITVFYGRDESDRKRFLASQKYAKLKKLAEEQKPDEQLPGKTSDKTIKKAAPKKAAPKKAAPKKAAKPSSV